MRTVFNTSFIVEDKTEREWLAFMQEEYLPSVRSLQACDDILFTRVSIDQEGGKTYSLQLVFHRPEDLASFREEGLPEIEARLDSRFRQRYLSFSSILTEV